jgi:hypothetical protein
MRQFNAALINVYLLLLPPSGLSHVCCTDLSLSLQTSVELNVKCRLTLPALLLPAGGKQETLNVKVAMGKAEVREDPFRDTGAGRRGMVNVLS